MKTINLGERVRVSDPCYDDTVWCKTTMDVLPGEYFVDVTESDEGDWGTRISSLFAIHKDYKFSGLIWESDGVIGVDSGQAGIFCESSYRNDSIEMKLPSVNFVLPHMNIPGDRWYEKICRFTLSEDQWGMYDTGVVSSTGFGDGMYPVEVARRDGNVIGIKITYISDEDEFEEEDED